MTDSNMFKVLLYSDGSQQSFSAAVYTAVFLKNMPNIQLTIVQIRETNGGSHGIEYSWKELRPKFKRSYWDCSLGNDYCWKDSWPLSPDQEWKKRVFEYYEMETYEYREILSKTNEIFSKRGLNVEHMVLCSNTSLSNTTDTANLILDYAKRNSFGLIIMGEREHSLLNLKIGDLAHSVRNKSTIPVVLVKKLPQKFIDSHLLEKQIAKSVYSNDYTSSMINYQSPHSGSASATISAAFANAPRQSSFLCKK